MMIAVRTAGKGKIPSKSQLETKQKNEPSPAKLQPRVADVKWVVVQNAHSIPSFSKKSSHTFYLHLSKSGRRRHSVAQHCCQHRSEGA